MRTPMFFPILMLATSVSAQMSWSSLALAGHDHPGLVADVARGRLVMVGGSDHNSQGWIHSTHEWDGVRWLARHPRRTPLGGADNAMTYDLLRSRTLLAGCNLDGPFETWEWDGSVWLERPSPNRPSTRFWHDMAYDWARQRTVLFGGTHLMAGTFRDTWEWDGTRWTRLQPAVSPPARCGHSMVFDLLRGGVLLFGGLSDPNAPTFFDDTWLWDGTNWTLLPTVTQPSPRSHAAVAMDLNRGRVVLHGGHGPSNQPTPVDTWEWNGATWNQMATTQPSFRDGVSIVYDPTSNRTVLCGSRDGSTFDMWSWDGSAWNVLPSPTEPLARMDHGLAFDLLRSRGVLFGGSDVGTNRLGDTWEWDGTSWTDRMPANAPSARSRHAVAYDPVRARTVLFGGDDGAVRADTWEWDGTSWTQRQPATSPPAQADHAMVWDGARQRVFLYGSAGSWEWDGSSWTARPSAARPPSTQFHAMTFDPRRGQVLLFGGTASRFEWWAWDGTNWASLPVTTPNPGPRRGAAIQFDEALGQVVLYGGGNSMFGLANDVWTWDGSAWTQRMPNYQFTSPVASYAHRMVYDSAHERVLLFGGSSFAGSFTYELGVLDPASYVPFGSGCAGNVGRPVLGAMPWQRPWQGETLMAQVAPVPAVSVGVMFIGTSNSTWQGLPLPLPLGVAGMPGCSLLSSGQLILPLQINAGVGRFSLDVPATAALLGGVFYQQAVVSDAPANAAGLIVSNGAEARIGRR
jgi:hypothetical protein